MPDPSRPLKKGKHERYAHGRANGCDRIEAYQKALLPEGKKPTRLAARSGGMRWDREPEIAARIEFLREQSPASEVEKYPIPTTPGAVIHLMEVVADLLRDAEERLTDEVDKSALRDVISSHAARLIEVRRRTGASKEAEDAARIAAASVAPLHLPEKVCRCN